MKALVSDGQGSVVLATVPEPQAGPGRAVVRVEAASLNRGDLFILDHSEAGITPGLDFAGTVVVAASDGRGPAVGTPVAGYSAGGAWAELCAVATDDLAVRPSTLDPALAAALPCAGLTALYALQLAPTLLGRSLLVTGATGGVGRLAIQLGVVGGAQVTAAVTSEARAGELSFMRDVRAVVDLPGDACFDVILDGIGGRSLTRAMQLVAPGGVVVTYGQSTWSGAAEIPLDWYHTHPNARLVSLHSRRFRGADDSGPGLAFLLDLVASGRLDVGVSDECGWDDLPWMIARLRDRQLVGKGVLRVCRDSATG